MDHNQAPTVCQRTLAYLERMCYNTSEPERTFMRRSAMGRALIMYDRSTRDFAIYLEGELVGYARSYLEAEAVLDQLHMELLRAETDQRVA